MSINSLPILDMHLFIHGTLKNREEFINYLRHTGHNIGFFYIKNHGIDPSLVKKMLVCTEVFFNLPQREKDKNCISNSPHYRGYGRLRAFKRSFKKTTSSVESAL